MTKLEQNTTREDVLHLRSVLEDKINELIDLPIIVLSNLGGDDDIKKAMELGADDYYVKSQHPMSEIIEKADKFAGGGHTLSKRKIIKENNNEEQGIKDKNEKTKKK